MKELWTVRIGLQKAKRDIEYYNKCEQIEKNKSNIVYCKKWEEKMTTIKALYRKEWEEKMKVPFLWTKKEYAEGLRNNIILSTFPTLPIPPPLLDILECNICLKNTKQNIKEIKSINKTYVKGIGKHNFVENILREVIETNLCLLNNINLTILCKKFYIMINNINDKYPKTFIKQCLTLLKDLDKEIKELFRDIINSCNEQNERNVNEYNTKLVSELNLYTLEYAKQAAQYNDWHYIHGGSEPLFFNCQEEFNKNKLYYHPISDDINDYILKEDAYKSDDDYKDEDKNKQYMTKRTNDFIAFRDFKRKIAETLKVSNSHKVSKIAGAILKKIKEEYKDMSIVDRFKKAFELFNSNVSKYEEMIK